ncbi:hypothetical protein Tco_1417436 [Tanacetum coccineum]
MLKDSINNDPYQMKEMTDPGNLTGTPKVQPFKRMQKEKDLKGDDKLRFEAYIDAMNFILLGIPNDITLLMLAKPPKQYDIPCDDQEDKLKTTMMLLARAITQRFSTPTNNHIRTSSNTRNQAYVQDGRVDVQTKNVGMLIVQGETWVIMLGVQGLLLMFIMLQLQREGHYARECPKTKFRDSNYFKHQMLLAKQDKAGIHLHEEHNNILLADIPKDEELQEIIASCIMLARIMTIENESYVEPSYDSGTII